MKLKTKLNKSLMLDTLIAAVLTDLAPGLLNKFVFGSNPLSGATLNVASAGAVYVAGALMKKPNVASVGVALAVANLVSAVIGNTLSGITGTPTRPATRNVAGVESIPALSDYMVLNDYISMPGPASGYGKYYE